MIIDIVLAQNTASSVEQRLSNVEVATQLYQQFTSLQLNVFMVFVGSLIGIVAIVSWVGVFAWIKKLVKDETLRSINSAKSEFLEKINDTEKKILGEVQTSVENLLHETSNRITGSEAEAYRLHGRINDESKKPQVAYIWWMRAALKYLEIKEKELVKTSFERALLCLHEIKSGSFLAADDQETQSLIASIPDNYKLEKQLLEQELFRIRTKPQSDN